MPSEIKFYYFKIRGRGEAIRHLLKLAKVKFDEVEIDQEIWPTLKEGKI